jgi:predicted transcriptional regulator
MHNHDYLQKYYLSTHRKRHALNITDIAFLLGIDSYKLSRFEQGCLQPELKVILGYHILFDLPIPTLIHEQYEKLKESIETKCFQLIEKLQKIKPNYKTKAKREAIHGILDKLMAQEKYGKE